MHRIQADETSLIPLLIHLGHHTTKEADLDTTFGTKRGAGIETAHALLERALFA
jgi:hypothetical protein